ncbi:MAG: hypothetical protein OEV55_00195 [candidate division Zixibacteria bacterium]|nr:hypothetical protein [candidate division Zixibacteria bacterium]
MIKKILLFSFFCTSILLLEGGFGYTQKELNSKGKEAADSTLILEYDSLLVIHFHPTAQCSCCINVGNFSKKGIEKFCPKLYKDRRIIFKECNTDEDSSVAQKYKIFGSALGFKKFLKGKEEFKEVESVWEFCEDEDKFLIDFQKELRSFVLGKKEGKSEKKSK